MVIASKKFSGNSTCVIAEKLSSGVYFAQFIYGKELVGKKTIVVPVNFGRTAASHAAVLL
jgi:hypothetical protein